MICIKRNVVHGFKEAALDQNNSHSQSDDTCGEEAYVYRKKYVEIDDVLLLILMNHKPERVKNHHETELIK